ncbi:Uncharacterised protein [Propionibacterium australiense]|uniref:Uncharacterized protein n=2 Tax=Propionibacterium australiense TaxID=119981 RepID=A0A8B3FVV5_9ACTN|nr:hypothetical protein D9T14_04675 [Propionibacterium australiense]RLP13000.1 hypothetical protein D7U36_00790 [Propionibacterium australiense]VEH91027.1 Uncharacterised protein [Propionibacterium australiense]
MKLMPFRTATDLAVECATPVLKIRGKSYEPDSVIPDWDYLTEVTVEGELTIKNDLLLSSTGLTPEPGLAGVRAMLRVDCPATGERFLGTSPLDPRDHPLVLVTQLPAGTVAEELEVRYEIVLDAPDGTSRADRAAHLRGSRLYESGRAHRFRLEGSGSVFPIEAFEFKGGDFPSDSVWSLRFQDDDLTAPYLSAVRLYVNTGHEEGAKLVEGRSDVAKSVLERDVLLQLLTKLVVRDRDDLGQEYPEGSAGAVIGSLFDLFLDQSLQGAAELMRDDPGRVYALLQGSTRFLRSDQ